MSYDVLLLNIHRKYFKGNINYGDFAGLYLITAFLEQNGINAKVFGGNLNQGWKIIKEECEFEKISMIGLYCDFENVTEIEAVCRRIKEIYSIPVIVGGPQATALDKQFMEKSGCDVIVRGEGELTMLELAHYFFDKVGTLYDINGIAFLDKGNYMIQPDQVLIENLDLLPFIDAKHSLNHDFRNLYSSIMTGRGCPFHCAFCHEGHHTKRVRFRSVDNVLQEIKQIFLVNPQQRYLLFTDDTFTLQPQRVKAICEGILELQKEHEFIWFCEGHVKTLCQNPEMIDDMVAAGLHRIQLGIEAGTQDVLTAYRKGSTPDDIRNLIALCRDKGVQQVFGNIILGGAHFSKEVWEQDKNFIKEILEIGQGILEIGVVFFWPLAETAMTKNPASYGITIADGNFITSFGDFPLTETKELTVWDINEMGKTSREEFAKYMESMLERKIIPHHRILSWFQTAQKCNAGAGMWLQMVEGKEPMASYYNLLASGAVARSADIPHNQLDVWHPQRVMSMSEYIETGVTGISRIGDNNLSCMERQILRYSTGKLALHNVLAHVYEFVKNEFTTYEKFEKTAKVVMEKMEERYWLVYSEM